MESSVGGWQIPDEPDQMVSFYRAKPTFRFRHQTPLIDDPTELRPGHEWTIVSKLKTCWITVAAAASFSFLQPLQTVRA